MSNARYRRWKITWNNPDVTAQEFFDKFKDLDLRYAVCQLEIGESGTPHFEGYLEFSKPIRFSTVKNKCPEAHLERCNGTHDENVAYCTKEETRADGPWYYGEEDAPKQGKRSDLLAVKEMIDKGATELEIYDQQFVSAVKYPKGISRYMSLRAEKRQKLTVMEVRYGAPGTGKTTSVQEAYPDAYWKMAGDWWDGYEGQSVVVLDEFYGWLPYNLLMRLGDATPLKVPVKGGFVEFVAERVIMISNKMPHDWYKFHEDKLDFGSLERRLSSIYLHRKDKAPLEFLEYQDFMEFQVGKLQEQDL